MRASRHLGVLLIVLAAPVEAQFEQYTQPGAPERPGESRAERLAEAVEEARWRLGGVRIDPWLGIRDLGWIDGASGSDPLWSVSAGAGVRAYLPTGPKVTWAAHFLPEYSWFPEDSDRNRLNGRFGIGAFAFFNRLTLEATATRTEALGVVTSEFQQQVNSRGDSLSLTAEVFVGGSLSVFGTGTLSQRENLLEEAERQAPGIPDLDLLNREERVYRAGLRFRTRRGWIVGLGAERSEADFDNPEADRSNSGTAPVLELTIPGRGLFLGLDLALRSLEPEAGSAFDPYDGVTGRFQVRRGEARRLAPTVYARRELVYAVGGPSYFQEDRAGLALEARLGWRTGFGAFAEVGENDYATSAGAPDRKDDVTALGLSVKLDLRRPATLVLGLVSEDYDSDLPGLDRSIETVRASIVLGPGASAWY